MKNEVTLYFNTDKLLEGKAYKNEENQFNEIITKYSSIKKLDSKFEISININKEKQITDFNDGFKFLVKEISFSGFNGERSCKKYNKGKPSNIKLQKEYFKTTFNNLTIEEIKNIANINTKEVESLEKIKEFLWDDTNKEEIKSNWVKKYKNIVSKLKLEGIQKAVISKIKDNKEVLNSNGDNSIIKYNTGEILLYSFFKHQNKEMNLVSVTLDYEDNELYGLEEIKERIKHNIGNLTDIGIYYVIYSKDNNMESKLYQTLENKDPSNNEFEIYFNKEKNICIEKRLHKKEEEEGYELKIEEYALALAYKLYYHQQEKKLAELTLGSSGLDETILFASEFARFQSNFIFENPTLIQSYKLFYENLELEKYEQRLIYKLDGIIKFIGLEHDKNEAARLKQEKIDADKEKILESFKKDKINDYKEQCKQYITDQNTNIDKVEADKNKKWSIIIGTIATIFTVTGGVAGGVDAFEKYLWITVISFAMISSAILFGILYLDNKTTTSIKKNKYKINELSKKMNSTIENIKNLSSIEKLNEFKVERLPEINNQ